MENLALLSLTGKKGGINWNLSSTDKNGIFKERKERSRKNSDIPKPNNITSSKLAKVLDVFTKLSITGTYFISGASVSNRFQMPFALWN